MHENEPRIRQGCRPRTSIYELLVVAAVKGALETMLAWARQRRCRHLCPICRGRVMRRQGARQQCEPCGTEHGASEESAHDHDGCSQMDRKHP